MFKIVDLVLKSYEGAEYTYSFKDGINYFIGANSTGKTVFYGIIDYMFGASTDINNNDWNNNSVVSLYMDFIYENNSFRITRTNHVEENYFWDKRDVESECLSFREYKERINEVFSHNEDLLRHLRDFTEEDYTFRPFTMFNFLGEHGQGQIRDFLDKCSLIEYSTKLNPILNYIFNRNIGEIEKIKQQIEQIKLELDEKKELQARFLGNCNQINANLLKLNIDKVFNGRNVDEIRLCIREKMNDGDVKEEKVRNTVGELEAIYSNISEQIKVYETTIKNYEQSKKENENRRKMLMNLQELASSDNSLEYLVKPIAELLQSVEDNITFSKYVISDETIVELRRQRNSIKDEIIRQNSKFHCYSLEEKKKAMALVQAYLEMDLHDETGVIDELSKKYRELKNRLSTLQTSDDKNKIDEFSKTINVLYLAGEEQSPFVRDDVEKGISIEYIKKGNILQPIKKDNFSEDEKSSINRGSMARHTLIQLCGYAAFLDLLLKEGKYPIIPMLVIDHISKPFSDENICAIGPILQKFINMVGTGNVQVFMFDDKLPEELGIADVHKQYLAEGNKTGFNPFYKG